MARKGSGILAPQSPLTPGLLTRAAVQNDSPRSAPGRAEHAQEQAAPAAVHGRSLKPLKALWPYLARYTPMVIAGLIALLVAAAATLALPLGVRRMIDLGFAAEDPSLIHSYFAVMIVIGLVLALSSAARAYCVNWLGERIVADLRQDVFAHLTRLSPAFFEETHSGELTSRLTADTTQIKAAVGAAASQALRNLVLIVGSAIMMVVTSPSLSAMVLIAIPVIVLPLVAYGRAVRSLSRHAQDTLAEANALASESLAAVRTLQAYTFEAAISARFARAVERAFEAARHRMRARAVLTALAMFLVFSSVVLVLWYGATQVLAGSMTGGRLGQFVIYAALAAGAMGELSEVWSEMQQAAGAAERLSELLRAQSAVVSPARPRQMPPPRGEIAFENVVFRYPTRPEVSALDDVTFRVAPGERVAIVGASGAGKSTIFALLLRFYDPQSGRVLVDGVPVNEVEVRQLRRRLALVPQETALFAGTVADNIRYGSMDASDEAVRAAAHAALADEFIDALPQGYDTPLGEGGVTLSGGQRQRIAIARAVLRDAPILLLDEATSALDAESERLVQTALERIMQRRTTLVIAHRLATVQRADRILVLQDGHIVEEGTHAALLKKPSGVYARLAAMQFVAGAAV